MRLARLVPLSAAIVAVAAAPASAADGFMSVQDFQFAPAMMAIQPGDKVDFNFEGPSQHTATLRARQIDRFDSGTTGPGFTPKHTFRFAGRFGLYCRIHPDMRAVVQVGGPETVRPRITKLKTRSTRRRVRVGFRLSERSVVAVTIAGRTVRRVLGRGGRSLLVRVRNGARRKVKVTAKDGWGNTTTVTGLSPRPAGAG